MYRFIYIDSLQRVLKYTDKQSEERVIAETRIANCSSDKCDRLEDHERVRTTFIGIYFVCVV